MADSPTLSTCGDTLVHPRLQNLQSQRVSRAGLVYGSSFSRGSCLDGPAKNRFNPEPEDMWYDSERFQLDHINEVLTKLNEGNLDDEIWGKIVVMERCKRIAKAYLRKTTIIVDGGDEEFDGKTLGFNYFSNSIRDDYTKELKTKIGDGVIIKMDNQGNIKAMARGSTPIFVQGWKDSKSHCISDKVIKCHGKLMNKSATSALSDEDRVVKIFDMRRFKQCVERDPYESENDAKNLLLKTCVRIALVKDGGPADPMKTPCWFMIINLVALDMLKTKLPSVCTSPVLSPHYSGTMESTRLSRIMSQVSLVPPPSELYSNPAALTQLIAAAVQQANSHYAGNIANSLPATSMPALNVDHIAKLASTLSLANPNLFVVNQNTQPVQQQQPQQTQIPKRIRRIRSFSDSEESEMEMRSSQVRSTTGYSESTTGSSSGISGVGRQKRFDSGINFKTTQMAKSMDALHERKIMEDQPKNNVDKYGRPSRPRLSADLFEKPKEQLANNKNWKSCASTTSDYDSNREVFDSGSWSSNSRVSTNSQNEPRSYSPSIISEPEPAAPVGSRRNSAPNETISLIPERGKGIEQSKNLDKSSQPISTNTEQFNVVHVSPTNTESTTSGTTMCIPPQRNRQPLTTKEVILRNQSNDHDKSDDDNDSDRMVLPTTVSPTKTRIDPSQIPTNQTTGVSSTPTFPKLLNTNPTRERIITIEHLQHKHQNSTDSGTSEERFEGLSRTQPSRRPITTNVSTGVGVSAGGVHYESRFNLPDTTQAIWRGPKALPHNPETTTPAVVQPAIRSQIYSPRSMQAWRTSGPLCQQVEPVQPPPPTADATATKTEPEQHASLNGSFNRTRVGQYIRREPLVLESNKNQNATSNEQPSYRINGTMGPAVQRWLSGNHRPMGAQLASQAASEANWRARKGPWDELLASRCAKREPKSASTVGMGSPEKPSSVRSLRDFYTELQQRKLKDYRQKTPQILTQRFHHPTTKSVDYGMKQPPEEPKKFLRFGDYPPPPPPQRLTSMNHHQPTNSFCIN